MSLRLPEVHSDCLDSGLELRAVEMKALPFASIALLVPAGSNTETVLQAGLGHLTGMALDAGTKSSDIHALAERIEFLGASLHVNVMHDAASIFLSTLTRHLDSAMEILGEILCTAVFPEQEVDRLRQTQCTALAQMRDRPGLRAALTLDRTLFGNGHPYGRPVMGLRDAVERLNHGDVRKFYEDRYRPHGTVAIAAGDISIGAWKELCERHLHDWQGRGVPSAQLNEPGDRGTMRILVVDRPASPQAEIRMGCMAMPRNHPDHTAAMLLSHALGGQFNSRINSLLREKRGLTYGAWSAFSALRTSGTFVQGGAFHTAGAAEAIRLLVDEIRTIAVEGISPEELTYAQRSMSGTFLRSFETPSQACARLQAVHAYDLPEDYYGTYLQRLNAVTHDDVRRVARRWLDPDRFTIVVVGDVHALRTALEQLKLGDVLPYEEA